MPKPKREQPHRRRSDKIIEADELAREVRLPEAELHRPLDQASRLAAMAVGRQRLSKGSITMNDDDGFNEFRTRHPQYSHLSAYEIDERGMDDDMLRGHVLDYAHEMRQRAEEVRRQRDEMIAQAKEVLRQLEADKARDLQLRKTYERD
jgi:hypothetical protein